MFRIASLQLVFDVLAKDNASNTFRQVGDSAGKAGKQAESGLGKVTNAAKMLGGALLGAGLIAGFKSLYDAADESRKIAARTEGVIKSMGNVAGVSAKQVGDLAGAISNKTGVDDEAIQSGQNLLLTFGNIRNEVGAGNDIFDQTSRLMVDMSAAMGKDASGSAIQLGKALNDPIKGISALSRVGVSFTEEQKDLIRTLVETGDTMGAQKVILGELEKQFGGAAESMATPMDRAKVAVGNLAEEMGGYLLPIVGEAADGLIGLIEGFKTGESTADGFQGAMQETGAVLADVAGAVGAIAGVVGDVAGFFTDLPGPIQLGVAALGGFIFLKGPISDFFNTLALKALYASDAIGSARTAGLRGAASGLVGFLGGPWGIAIGAAVAGLGFLAAGFGDTKDTTVDAEEAQRGFADAVREADGAITQSVRSAAAKATEDAGLLELADQMGIKLSQVTDAALGNADAYGLVDAAVERYLQTALKLAGGNTEDAAFQSALAAADQFRGGLEVLVPTVEETAAKQDRLAEATTGTGDAASGAVPVVDAFKQGLEAAGEAASDAQRETNMFKTALDVLTGATVSMIEVESSYYAALEDATGALKDLNGTVVDGTGKLNTQSEAGRAASDVLLEVRDSGNQLIATMVQQGRSADEVGAAEERLRRDFINTAGQMGITGVAAENLANEILGIPDQRRTTITAPTAQAVSEVQFLKREIQTLQGKTVTVSVVHDRRALATYAAQNGMQTIGGYAGGGWTGPGAKYTPAGIVHADEFVFTKEQTRRLGVNQLEMLANGAAALVPGYADGGIVVRGDSSDLRAGLQRMTEMLSRSLTKVGVAGAGSVGGAWGSLWSLVKAAIPQARINSTFRAGDPGYHGRGKAIDFGFGSGPGGAGSAGLASINRLLHDRVGRNLAELIYDGVGDDRPDLKNGRPLTYSAGTRAAHRNHVHAAVYADGTNYVPQTGYAVVHKGEAIVPASKNQGAPWADQQVVINVNGTFDLASSRDLRRAAETIRRELVSLEREAR